MGLKEVKEAAAVKLGDLLDGGEVCGRVSRFWL